MPKKPTNDVLKARVEAAELLGFGDDPQRLCIADRLRVDLVVSLRAAIDHASASLLDDGSNSSDLARLVNAVEYLTKLLPERQLAAPESQRDDPRQTMFRIYMEMRERGALGYAGYDGKCRQVEALQAEVATLTAEIAALKSAPGSAPALPDVATLVERMPAPAGNVVPLPPKPPSAPAAPQSSAAPAYDYNKERGWRDHVLPSGEITPTPMSRGRRWGPV
jgi:hypothetical protein